MGTQRHASIFCFEQCIKAILVLLVTVMCSPGFTTASDKQARSESTLHVGQNAG